MNVTLSGEVEEFVLEEITRGHYDSAQEVVREGLRLLHERSLVEQQRARLNDRIEAGLAQLDRGEGIPGDQVFAGDHRLFSHRLASGTAGRTM